MSLKLDLFELHDSQKDDSLRKFIMARGSSLKKTLSNLMISLDKTKLVKHLMQRFNVSITSAERWVYLKREWYPLCFIEELLKLTNNESQKYTIQDKIEYLKANQPPARPVKAVKELSLDLCKLAGAHAADGTLSNNGFLKISDFYLSNLNAFAKWLEAEFNFISSVKRNTNSSQEFYVMFKNKVISRYFSHILMFNIGCKQYTVKEPLIIKNSKLIYRKAFALGALTFEAGVGTKHQVELCVASKSFKDDISKILSLSGAIHCSAQKSSGGYWRLWSGKIDERSVEKWMCFFEEGTEKWYLLKSIRDGFNCVAESYDKAISILSKVYPKKPGSKASLIEILRIIQGLKEACRYKICDVLCKEKNLSSFGGKWAHSIVHYLKILEMANIISKEKKKFGDKRSFGSIIREVYTYNPKIDSWRLPIVVTN